MLVDIGLKFYAVPSRPTWVIMRSMSWVIDFNRFSGKAQVRQALISYFCSQRGGSNMHPQSIFSAIILKKKNNNNNKKNNNPVKFSICTAVKMIVYCLGVFSSCLICPLSL